MERIQNWESKIHLFSFNEKGEHIIFRLSRMSFDVTDFELKLPFHLYAFSPFQVYITEKIIDNGNLLLREKIC